MTTSLTAFTVLARLRANDEGTSRIVLAPSRAAAHAEAADHHRAVNDLAPRVTVHTTITHERNL